MKWDPIDHITRSEIENLIANPEIDIASLQRLMFVIAECGDVDWSIDILLQFLKHDSKQVAGCSAAALGDLARLYGLNNRKDFVCERLRDALKNNHDIAPRIETALSDINIFLK